MMHLNNGVKMTKKLDFLKKTVKIKAVRECLYE